jgi:hypothetical protein
MNDSRDPCFPTKGSVDSSHRNQQFTNSESVKNAGLTGFSFVSFDKKESQVI